MSLIDAFVVVCDALIAIVVILFVCVLCYSIVDFVLEVLDAEEELDPVLSTRFAPVPQTADLVQWQSSTGQVLYAWRGDGSQARPPYDWEKEEQDDGADYG